MIFGQGVNRATSKTVLVAETMEVLRPPRSAAHNRP